MKPKTIGIISLGISALILGFMIFQYAQERKLAKADAETDAETDLDVDPKLVTD